MKEKLEKLTEVLKDEKLAKELFSKKDPADAQKWIKEHGVDMTLDEVKELGGTIKGLISGRTREDLEKMAVGEYELTDDELKKVSGGLVFEIVAMAILAGSLAVVIAEKAGWID